MILDCWRKPCLYSFGSTNIGPQVRLLFFSFERWKFYDSCIWAWCPRFTDPKQVTIVDGEGHRHFLSRYFAGWRAPRPESFTIVSASVKDKDRDLIFATLDRIPRIEEFLFLRFQDMDVAKSVSKSKREDLYHDIATAAESGWDFGSRWMRFVSSFVNISNYIF